MVYQPFLFNGISTIHIQQSHSSLLYLCFCTRRISIFCSTADTVRMLSVVLSVKANKRHYFQCTQHFGFSVDYKVIIRHEDWEALQLFQWWHWQSFSIKIPTQTSIYYWNHGILVIVLYCIYVSVHVGYPYSALLQTL